MWGTSLRIIMLRFHRQTLASWLLFLACWIVPAAGQAVSPALFSGLKWRLIGPFRGGRAVAATGVSGNPTTFVLIWLRATACTDQPTREQHGKTLDSQRRARSAESSSIHETLKWFTLG